MTAALNFEFDVRIPDALIQQMMDGEITCSMLVTMNVLRKWADWSTGHVRFCSAGGLVTATHGAYSERTFQDSLKRLEDMGWITRHMTPGSHKSYPVTLDNYKVTDAAGKVHILNPKAITVSDPFKTGACGETSDEGSDEASDEGSDRTNLKRISKRISTPATPGGGAGAEKSFDPSQQPPQKSTTCEPEALTEQAVIDALQETYFAKLDEQIKFGEYRGYPEDVGVPKALNTAGSRDLFDRLVSEFHVTRSELDVVGAAFGDWFDAMYLLGFKNKYEAERRNNDAEEKNREPEYVPQPIQCPLKLFTKNLKPHLDANRRWRMEEAEEQASASVRSDKK